MTAQNFTQNSSSALAPGFDTPVVDSQSCFRAIMNAMARPGQTQRFTRAPLDVPAPLTPLAAAIALTLFDYDTPIWLDPDLMESSDALGYLRFHTGAPVTSDAAKATFALLTSPRHLPDLSTFAQGSAEYPDTSTTLILAGQNFSAGPSVSLTGPGIRSAQGFRTDPVSGGFWQQMQFNNTSFPCGVDVVFASDDEIAALPRSTKITIAES
ncbi:MAG: phosphonate C-P lyase system protein PhnH [Rhodobacteraceae bacterium]|nr:phosphonate C-P lyase system protein PhnH [Paracoccaceae bacterium]